MKLFLRLLGSLKLAVLLLVVIAGVLAWGTIYETRFGTAAVQRFIYQSARFQSLLGFLAINLTIASLQRAPWKSKHVPFVSAHIGIILILIGGILGGRFGVEGQLILSEGETSSTLQLPASVLAVHQPNPGIVREFPTHFEAAAWNHEPHALFTLPVKGRTLRLVVDRYFPNAVRQEEITDDGEAANPAIHVTLRRDGEEEGIWLLSKDLDRFGIRWNDAHLFFLEPDSESKLNQLLAENVPVSGRGEVQIELPDLGLQRSIRVPENLSRPVPIPGTPYRLLFKEYFTDFALSENGPINRSERLDNPAVALTLSGPEGTDAQLLFALHPDFAALHGRQPKIHARLTYHHPGAAAFPPNSLVLVRISPELAGQLRSGRKQERLLAVLFDAEGGRRTIEPLQVGTVYPWMDSCCGFEVTALYPRARIVERFSNRDNDVRAEMIHLVAEDGGKAAQAWLSLRGSAQLALLEEEPLIVEYRQQTREIPFSVKLVDFRKLDYPGTQMAAGFESDVELTDPKRGVALTRTISMNNPLKYRGYSLFQSSYIPGQVETTVLSVRNDPGTPLVYAGFLVVLFGVIALFSRQRGVPPVRSAP